MWFGGLLVLLASLVVGGAVSQSVSWSPCPLYSNTSVSGSFSVHGGESELTADCANLSLPLDWSSTSSTKIQIFVKRVNSASGKRKGQLWLLNGGPGGSGAGMEVLIPVLSQLMGDYDLMIPDHRGTGRSAALWCPEIDQMRASPTTDTIKSCVSYLEERFGDDLHHYTTTNAALDLRAAINLTATEDDVINIYGVSYGTYLAQRYMILAPDQADRITIDGICPPDVCRSDYYDVNNNIVGSDLMTLCGEESKECRDNLGEFPMETLAMLMELTQSGKDDCTKLLNISATKLRNTLSGLLVSEQQRLLIAPLVHKLTRCNTEDIKEVTNFMEFLEQQSHNQSKIKSSTANEHWIVRNVLNKVTTSK